MTNYNSVILSPACFEEETGLLKKYPVGTGRYILKEVVDGSVCNYLREMIIIMEDPAKVKNIQK